MIGNRMITGILAGCCAAMAGFFQAHAAADELVLIEDGESLAPVVIFQDAPPKTLRAAEELVDYLEKISGVRPELIVGTPDPVPESAIWVGYQPVLNDLFPDLNFDFEHAEEILIAANDSHLVIAGRDRWHPDHLVVELRRDTIEGRQQEYGTINAVYTFLQDYLDVRWLWPGEMGTDIVPMDRIAFAPFEYRYHPQFRVRGTLFRLSDLGDRRGHSHEWVRLQRLQLDSMEFDGGHPFAGWWNRFGKDHPEFFALLPDGTRGGGEEAWPNPRTVKMCKSNPGLWDQWLADVTQALERDPNRLVFGANANDSGSRGYCICEACLAWDNPEGAPAMHTWEGLSQEYVTMADRQITLANQLAGMLKERFPDKDLFVSAMAYGSSRPAPELAKADDNVMASAVANFHNRYGEGSDQHREDLRAWSEAVDNIFWRPNLGGGAGRSIGLPNSAPHAAIQDMRFAADLGVMGLFFDTMWEQHWSTQGPYYYMLAQMAWNPYADGEAILADYYQRGFGPAADEIEAYWTLMEETATEILKGNGTMQEIWDETFFETAEAHLDRASAAVEGEDEIYAERIDFLRAGLGYSKLRLDIVTQREQVRELLEPDPAVEASIRETWKKIGELDEANPGAFHSWYLRRDMDRALEDPEPED